MLPSRNREQMGVQFGILGKFLHVVDLSGLYVETI